MEPFGKLLMPEQENPFNGDHFIASEFLVLRDRFSLEAALELGTCLGSSSLWMSDYFKEVYTIEINSEFRDYALKRFAGKENIISYLGDTVEVLPSVLLYLTSKTMILVDSHWMEHFPLLQELTIIAGSKLKPVLAIHDCMVPNEPSLGYDSYGSTIISFETMKPYLDEIYGENGYNYHYNSAEKSTAVKRGIIFVYPKVHQN